MAKTTKKRNLKKTIPNFEMVENGDKWIGEELVTQSDTKLESDLGQGEPLVLRFFEYGANQKTFKDRKPTAQELFNSHAKELSTILWRDGLKPVEEIDPRIMFSKNKKNYKFVITCRPTLGNTILETPLTLSQIANNK